MEKRNFRCAGCSATPSLLPLLENIPAPNTFVFDRASIVQIANAPSEVGNIMSKLNDEIFCETAEPAVGPGGNAVRLSDEADPHVGD